MRCHVQSFSSRMTQKSPLQRAHFFSGVTTSASAGFVLSFWTLAMMAWASSTDAAGRDRRPSRAQRSSSPCSPCPSSSSCGLRASRRSACARSRGFRRWATACCRPSRRRGPAAPPALEVGVGCGKTAEFARRIQNLQFEARELAAQARFVDAAEGAARDGPAASVPCRLGPPLTRRGRPPSRGLRRRATLGPSRRRAAVRPEAWSARRAR
jgi:hypothetical protein